MKWHKIKYQSSIFQFFWSLKIINLSNVMGELDLSDFGNSELHFARKFAYTNINLIHQIEQQTQ